MNVWKLDYWLDLLTMSCKSKKILPEHLSIRARLAYAARCLELAVEQEGAHNQLFEKIITQIWSFTQENRRLDIWDNQSTRFLTEAVTTDYFAATDYNDFTEQEIEALKQYYEHLPGFIKDMIDETIWIGIGNLYGAVVGKSKPTLKPLEKVIELMTKNNIPLPPLNTFAKSTFEEDEGWGFCQPREFYLSQ